MGVYVCMENSSEEIHRLLHQFYVSCQKENSDYVDRSNERKKLIHQLFLEMEMEIEFGVLDEEWVLYDAID